MSKPKFIEFRVSNYRSICDELIFSMEANPKIPNRAENTFDLKLSGDQTVKLLKTVAIYGPNASGKSNFLRAFNSFCRLVETSASNNLESTIEYDPYELEDTMQDKPTSYLFEFVGTNLTRFRYQFSHTATEFLSEDLEHYSDGNFQRLFTRSGASVTYGVALENRSLPNKIIAQRLALSDLANNHADDFMGAVYKSLLTTLIWDANNADARRQLLFTALKSMNENGGNNKTNEWINRLISEADLQTMSMRVEEKKDSSGLTPNASASPEDYTPYTKHKRFKDKHEVGTKEFQFFPTASDGTKSFVGLGGIFAQMIDTGGFGLFDELNSSLHPDLCALFVKLFNDAVSNPNNAQLIFSTHDISLIDKTFLRKDQVWFAQKNQYGSTELYSAQDFDNVPDDVSLAEWYDAGNMRAKPKINETGIKFPPTK